jgi:hypothetical protein
MQLLKIETITHDYVDMVHMHISKLHLQVDFSH